MADVGDDIFSIIQRFATPRQAAEPAPTQPQPVPMTPANVPQMGAQQGPPIPPEVVQGPPVPPALQPRVPVDTAPTGSVEPPQPVSTKTLSTTPSALDLTKQFLDIQKQQRREAALEDLPGQIAHSGAALGAALTRSPSARESLTSIANARAAMPQSGVGNLTAESFLNFQKQADVLQGRVRFAQALPELSKRTGMTPTQLQAMYDADPKSVSNLLETIGKEGTEKSRLELGLKGREQQVKEAELGIKQTEEQRAAQTFSTAEKVRLSSDAAIPELSRITGQPVEVIQGLNQDQRAKLLEQQVKPMERTAEQKTLDQINKERAAAKLDPYTMEQYRDLENKKTENLKRIEAGFGPQASAATKANEDADNANKAILQSRVAREQARNAAFRGGEAGIYAGGGPLTDWAIKYQKFLQGVTGRPNQKISNTEVYTASLAADVLNTVKGLGAGTAISDSDRKFAEQAAGGSLELNPESMRRLLTIRDKLDRQKIEANNQSIDRRYQALPGLARIVEPTAVPQQDKESLRYTDNTDLLNALTDPNSKQYFEMNHGKGSHEEFQNRMDEVIQSKMQTLNEKTRTWSNDDKTMFDLVKKLGPDDLEKRRAALEDRFTKDYGADQGSKLLDVIIAAKRAGRF